MKHAAELRSRLREIDGKGYGAYKRIQGAYQFEQFRLIIDKVQGDPFAAPSAIRIRVPQDIAQFPQDTFQSRSRYIALCDYLARQVGSAAQAQTQGNRGSGKSGRIAIDQPGQEILERTCVTIDATAVEARLSIGLPAFGRKVAGKHADVMFFRELPAIIEQALLFASLSEQELYTHITVAEDADAVREQLREQGLVAFVANDAVLPRRSGVDQRPLTGSHVVPFSSPESLETTLSVPNAGNITGMGVPHGVSVIVGGGYHGKSTLLEAIELGVYNHIPGDGREFVVTVPTAMKIRSEDGRHIEKTDISPFIQNVPSGTDTQQFSSDNASGSTSQAANIVEAVELGSSALLIDEDTSATNFMIRDLRMQALVAKEKEPITPFLEKVSSLCTDCNIATIIVMGGSGDYFDVADHVISMSDYRPYDVTSTAHTIAQQYRSDRQIEDETGFSTIRHRIPLPSSVDARKGKKLKVKAQDRSAIHFGQYTIAVTALEQLADVSQTRAIANAIVYMQQYIDGQRTIADILARVEEDIAAHGLDILSPGLPNDFAQFRMQELGATLNRLRSLSVKQAGQ